MIICKICKTKMCSFHYRYIGCLMSYVILKIKHEPSTFTTHNSCLDLQTQNGKKRIFTHDILSDGLS